MSHRIGIVDGHPAMILGVASILNAQDGLHVAVTASCVADLLETDVRLDLVLLDLSLVAGGTPAENVALVRRLAAPLVLVHVDAHPQRLVREALSAGAAGAVRKSESPAVLARVVRAALNRGTAAVTGVAAPAVLDRVVRPSLTSREAEVLTLYAGGLTAAEVAQHIFVSRETVIDHIRRIRAKYTEVGRSAPSKVALYRRAVEDGLEVRSVADGPP
ncbi:MAG: DNA-binding response regulator [Nocardioides sp.]|uniref:response regulator transcription factor n=1 Tax=Nocardioides sp. TaxID=35761 RepID=UPI003EFF4DF0